MKRTSLEDFLKDITSIREYIKHIDLVNKVAANSKNSREESLMLFNEHFSLFKMDKRIYEYKSIVISLYGLIEKHIELWIKEHIDNLSLLFENYHNIPNKITKSHFDLSIKLITLISENKYNKYNNLTKEDLLNNLNICIHSPSKFKFNSDAFAPMSGNLKHNKIVESFENINIKLNDKLLNNKEFSTYLISKFGQGIENEKPDFLYSELNQLVDFRNEIAHGVEITQILNKTELESYIEFLLYYGQAIFDVLREKEIEYEIKNSYMEIDDIIDVYNSSILAFNIEYYKIQKGDFIIVETSNKQLFKKKVMDIQLNNISYDQLSINEKSSIAINLDNGIKKNYKFYLKKRNRMSNIIKAFINIVNNYKLNISDITQGNNRANSMGEGLESYIKDIFAGTSNETVEQKRLEELSRIYSYQGNKNNPPDLMLRNSDAIEIKKLESKNSAIALNSSYPKAKLYADSPMITTACKECEEWSIKDMLYAVGYTNQSVLKSLWLVYGDCFCADKETYERIKNTISSGINTISDVEFTETKELGKVKKVDPLGITDLRIRGMWHIDNPNKTFNYIYTYDETKDFQLMCLMKKEKYESLPTEDKEAIENIENNNVDVQDIRIKNPNNPVQLIDAKLLIFKV